MTLTVNYRCLHCGLVVSEQVEVPEDNVVSISEKYHVHHSYHRCITLMIAEVENPWE